MQENLSETMSDFAWNKRTRLMKKNNFLSPLKLLSIFFIFLWQNTRSQTDKLCAWHIYLFSRRIEFEYFCLLKQIWLTYFHRDAQLILWSLLSPWLNNDKEKVKKQKNKTASATSDLCYRYCTDLVNSLL